MRLSVVALLLHLLGGLREGAGGPKVGVQHPHALELRGGVVARALSLVERLHFVARLDRSLDPPRSQR